MKIDKLHRKKLVREDGWLSEVISSKHNDTPFRNIHTYIVVINPGKTRAKHFHKEKEEWLSLSSGRIQVTLEDIQTKERTDIILDEEADDFEIVHVPNNIAHAVMNIGDSKASLIVFSQKPEIDGDTIPYELGAQL